MQFRKFSDYLETLEQTPSRLEMMYKLADLYKELSTDEITQASYLMQGNLVSRYLSLEFQLSAKMVVRALTQIYSENKSEPELVENSLFGEVDSSFSSSDDLKTVTTKYKKSGDVGIVAREIIQQLNVEVSTSLSIIEVHEKLKEVAIVSGLGSQDKKIQLLVALLKNLDPVSAKFVSRVVIGKLRLGFSAMTILDALSWAAIGSKSHRNDLEVAYQKRADIGELSRTYLALLKETDGISEDELISSLHREYLVVIGTPIVPALCQRLNTSQEIIDKMIEVIAEPKYDGLRIQIHYSKKGYVNDETGRIIKAFTRNLEDVTHMFPELNELSEILSCDDCILDAEAIGYNKDTGILLPFQETITRKRKHSVAEQSSKVPIRFYFFDCMFLNNESLLEKKLRERKDLLRSLFEDSDVAMHTEYITTTDPKILKDFHYNQLGDGLEGAVMKQVDSHYQSGRKGWIWVKIKEEEGSKGKLKDTLDLVVMGYYYGRGKRSKFGIGAFLVGALNENQEVKTMAKVGTGLTDDQFIDMKKRGEALTVEEKPSIYEVAKILIPDVWMSPELVVEIAADEITKSPSHTAGVALRFPRLVKIRDDKQWSDATTIKELDKF